MSHKVGPDPVVASWDPSLPIVGGLPLRERSNSGGDGRSRRPSLNSAAQLSQATSSLKQLGADQLAPVPALPSKRELSLPSSVPSSVNNGSKSSKIIKIETPWTKFVALCNKAVSHKITTFVMALLTVYALFGDDVRQSACPPSFDIGFNVLTTIAFVCFTLELLASCVGKVGYLGGFYFWLDAVSTISLLPDTGFVDVFGSGGEGGGTLNALKAGRASRAARATRVIRLVRLVRMVRVVKLYKLGSKGDDIEVNTSEATLEPTKVGKKLNEMTTRKLILMILGTVIVLPWLTPEFWSESGQTTYAEAELGRLFELSRGPKTQLYTVLLDRFKSTAKGRLLYLHICTDQGTDTN